MLLISGRVVPPTGKVQRNTERLLQLFDDCDVKATWFVLGEIADAFPSLVRRIADAGHSLGVHGYHHHPAYKLTRTEFRNSLRNAKEAVEKASGKKVVGHRAVAFSLGSRTPWAFDVIKELGFQYDSSIFPFKGRRYGVADAPLVPYTIQTESGPILELPLSVLEYGLLRLPCSGGGYLRHFPTVYTHMAFRALTRLERSGIIYIHPYEVDVEYDAFYFQMLKGRIARLQFKWVRYMQYRNRCWTISKLRYLLSHHNFSNIEEVFRGSLVESV
ncbi:MAG: polysaccharide deacetylase family protein [Limisphaerales bacterium]